MSDKAKVEEKRDRRVEFLQEFTLKSMRLKIDKWNKIVVHDEQRQYLQVNATTFLTNLRKQNVDTSLKMKFALLYSLLRLFWTRRSRHAW